jgi:hypothetical protein
MGEKRQQYQQVGFCPRNSMGAGVKNPDSPRGF